MKRALPLCLCASLLAITPAANAKAPDLDPVQVEAATRYALPHMFTGYIAGCRPHLQKNGYVLRNADRLSTKFTSGSAAYWPKAKVVVMQMATAKDGGNDRAASMMSNLPDDALRPFVNGLITSMVVGEMKPELCSDLERGLEILDPLPAENYGKLAVFVYNMVEREKQRDAALARKKARAGNGAQATPTK
ncbi:hypothetical protein ACXYL9_07550 [Qipengyuania sp. CAU 1752]